MINLTFDKESYDFDVAQKIIDIVQEESIESCKRLSIAFGFYGDEWQSAKVGRSTEKIQIKIFTRNIRAFITEFGYGSMMAEGEQNPFLAKYVADAKVFNQDRKDQGMAILRRGKAPYSTLNWEGGENAIYTNRLGGSEPKGENLEGKQIGRWAKSGLTVKPKAGKFIFNTELKLYKSRVLDRIQDFFQNELIISKYIVGGD